MLIVSLFANKLTHPFDLDDKTCREGQKKRKQLCKMANSSFIASSKENSSFVLPLFWSPLFEHVPPPLTSVEKEDCS